MIIEFSNSDRNIEQESAGAAPLGAVASPPWWHFGIVAAVAASLLYNASIALQALEAREVPGEHSLRPSLIGRLVRNRRWLGATALGLAGWPLEVAALLLAPLTVVQPCLASGLILLLWLGATQLGERPGRASGLPWRRSCSASPALP